MKRLLKLALMVAAGLASQTLVARPAGATGQPAPPLWASYPSYTGSPAGAAAAGPFCMNTPENMPPGRQSFCGTPVRTHPSTGVYTISVTNGAPLPVNGSPGLGNDGGYAVFVTAVNSNAVCSETGFQVTGNDILSTIRCVRASDGANVDSEFSWTYRNDSIGYWQAMSHPLNLIYARVRPGTTTQFVDTQTFNPFPETMSVTRLPAMLPETGRFQVKFDNVNGQSSQLDINGVTGMNNVIVQRTCTNTTDATCLRSVCIPYTWSGGSGAPGSGITMEVRCYKSNGARVDVDFRVLVANESHTSQMQDVANTGIHYAWLNSPTLTGMNCKTTDQIKHRSQHELPQFSPPTEALQTCRTATGTYRTTFQALGFYHRDAVSALVSSRGTGGTYCNVSRIDCGNVGCNASTPPFVDVKCYDRTGVATDALWNLSIVY